MGEVRTQSTSAAQSQAADKPGNALGAVSSRKPVAKTMDHVIEATFRSATKVGMPVAAVEHAARQSVTPVNPEFPPWPKCGAARYWISRGMVLCGSRTCYSAVRFVLTKIEYHPVQ